MPSGLEFVLTRPGGVIVTLSLVGLWAVAAVQPLLELLGRNAAFLVAQEATTADTLLLVAVLTFGVPVLLALVVELLGRRNVTAGIGLLGGLITLFGGLLFLVVGQLSGWTGRLSAPVALLLAGGVGTVLAAGYLCSRPLRAAVAATAVVAPLVALMFLFATPARSVAFPGFGAPSVPPGLTLPADPPPIVMVVLDELPLATLVDSAGGLQADVFPNFARLADDATLLRNVTTVHGQTSDSVPAMLTSRYPRTDTLPLAADHPNNLFALLADTYRLRVEEPLTQLCAGRCGSSSASFLTRQARLYPDLAVVAGHLFLPAELVADLPPLDQGWRDFRSVAAEAGKEGAVTQRFRAARRDSPVPAFQDFVAGIEATRAPTLHYIHTLLPHSPWRYLPDGTAYADTQPSAGLDRGRWTADPWPVAQGFQRHLLQTQLADRLLGQLLDRLEAQGIYDDALLVVVSDHGASFSPATSLRVISEATLPEIARVPLLIKRPGQAEPEVIDRALETIDLLPTLFDALGAQVPDGLFHGMSAFDTTVPDRGTRRFFGPAGAFEFASPLADIGAAVDRKLQWFSSSPDGFVFGLVPPGRQALLGQAVAESAPAARGGWVVGGSACQGAAPDEDQALPVLFCATVRLDGVATDGVADVALAVDGRVAAVTQVRMQELGTGAARALLPDGARTRDLAQLQLFLVRPDGSLAQIPPATP